MEINYGLEKETRVRLLVYVARHHTDTDPPVILWPVMSCDINNNQCWQCDRVLPCWITADIQRVSIAGPKAIYFYEVVCQCGATNKQEIMHEQPQVVTT